MVPEEIGQQLKERLGEQKVLDVRCDVLDPYIRLSADALRDAAKWLRDQADLRFDALMCLSAVHYPADGEIEVVYHLYSMQHRHRITLKVRVPEDRPRVPSVADIWPTADWHEREAYDLVGVIFEGHPNLRRILLPEDWDGHPLRKDYVEQDEYHGIPVPYALDADADRGVWVFADEMNWDAPRPPRPPEVDTAEEGS